MTPEQLDALEAVAKAATPGPWSGDRADAPAASWEVWGHDGSDYENFIADCRTGGANAAHIATFDPPQVLALIAEIRRLQGELGVSRSQPVLVSNDQPEAEPSAIKPDPLAVCGRCGQRHVEHGWDGARGFRCHDGGLFKSDGPRGVGGEG